MVSDNKKHEVRKKLTLKKGIEIEDPSVCYFCKKEELQEDVSYCPDCGFPQGKEKPEQLKFITTFINKKKLLKDIEKAIKKSQNILYIIAAFTLLSGAIIMFTTEDVALLVVNIILALLYFVFGFYSKKHPVPTIASGFGLYMVIIILNAIVDPSTIYHGIIFKIIFITALVYGLKGALQTKTVQKDLAIIEKAQQNNITPDLEVQ